VTDHYSSYGYFEDTSSELVPTACADRALGAAGQCLGFIWTPDDRSWVGVALMSAPDNWIGPGLCIAEGATKAVFRARGANGGEVVGFNAAGEDMGSEITLSSSWQTFEIDISGVDYNALSSAGGVTIAFSIVLLRYSLEDIDPKTIYVDDIRWVAE